MKSKLRVKLSQKRKIESLKYQEKKLTSGNTIMKAVKNEKLGNGIAWDGADAEIRNHIISCLGASKKSTTTKKNTLDSQSI